MRRWFRACCARIRVTAPRRVRRHPGLHSMAVRIFRAGQPDDQHQRLRRLGAGDRYPDMFGLNNHFVAGVSFDGAQTEFTGVSYVGGITSGSRVVHWSRRGHRRARQQRAGAGGDQRRVLRCVPRRHVQPDGPPGADASGPVQCGADQPQRPERRRPYRQSRLSALQSRGRA